MYLLKLYGGWFSFVLLAVSIALLFFAIKEHRDKQGGYITFGDAFLVAFLSALIGGFIGYIWLYLQQHYITPDMLVEQADAAAESMSAWINDEAALEQIREKYHSSTLLYLDFNFGDDTRY
jgi:prolipoprotein diacylglyceryltransferase